MIRRFSINNIIKILLKYYAALRDMQVSEFTPFQMWTMFIMLQNTSTLYTVKDLMAQCCNSSLSQLNPNSIETELNRLLSARLIEHSDTVHFDLSPTKHYQISTSGIYWIRQNIHKVITACKDGKIDRNMVRKQDLVLVKSLYSENGLLNEDDDISLTKTILEYGIKNITPIMFLIKFASTLS